jgi:hypothetical protein
VLLFYTTGGKRNLFLLFLDAREGGLRDHMIYSYYAASLGGILMEGVEHGFCDIIASTGWIGLEKFSI